MIALTIFSHVANTRANNALFPGVPQLVTLRRKSPMKSLADVAINNSYRTQTGRVFFYPSI